jgi:hypothetical protein
VADNDVQVTFGGDLSALNSATAAAKSSVLGLKDQLNALDATVRNVNASIDDDAVRMRTLALAGQQTRAELAGLEAVAGTLGGSLESAGTHAASLGAHSHAAGAGTAFWTRELRALGDELSSGRYRQADGTFLNLAVHAVQAGGAWAMANPVLVALGAAAVAATAAMAYLVYEAVAANNAMHEIQLDAVVAQFALTDAEANALRDSIEGLANVSASSAEEIAKPFIALGQGGQILAQLVAPYLPMLAEQMGKKLPEAADEVAKRFKDLSTSGRSFVDASISATSAQRQLFEQFVASGETGRAWGVIVDVMKTELEAYREKQALANAALQDSVPVFDEAGLAAGAFASKESEVGAATAAATAKMQAQEAQAASLRTALEGVANATRTFQAGMTEALKVDKVAEDIKTTTDGIRTLEAGIAAAGDKSSPAIDQMGRSLEMLRDKLVKLKEQSADGILGRDALKQAQDANSMLGDTHKGSQVDLLTQQRNNLQGAANAAAPGSQEQIEALKDVADKTKEITAAEYADFKAAEDLKVAAAGKNSAAVIAIREQEAAHARDVFGAGSNEERSAIEAVVRAKEQAVNRGAAAATKAAKDELGATEEGIKGQIQQIEAATQRTIEGYDIEFKLKQITEQKKLQLVTAALTAEKAQVDALYAQEDALAGLSLTKKKEIGDQELAFNNKNALAILNAQKEAATKTEQAWDSSTKSINGAFDSQINGLLTGTTSWHQATLNVLKDLTEQVIKFFVNWGLQAVENEAKQILLGNSIVMAHTTGDAAMTAADQTAGSAGALSWIGSAIHSIQASAAQTFAGVTGFMAPIIGPAAPAAGAAAEASVLAVAGGLYDAGSWSLPSDMLIGAHKGEMIIPQRGGIADEFRSFMAGGGLNAAGAGGKPVNINPTTNFHVSAVDSGSVAQWMKANSHQMMKAIDEAVRHGAHLGMRRLATT